MGGVVMIITDAMMDAAMVAFKASDFDLRAALEAALAASPLDEVTRDRCAEAVDVILHHAKAAHSESGYYGGAISALLSAVAAIRALPVAPMFPEPMRELPEYGQAIWIVNLSRLSFCETWAWVGGTHNMRDFHNGLCHASKEAAEAHGGFLVSLSAKTEDAA